MNTKTPDTLYRVVAVRDGQPTKRTILFPGPLTLKEAQENARQRFRVRLKRAQTEHRLAQRYWKQLEDGVPVAVHKKPALVSKCGPFKAQKEKA